MFFYIALTLGKFYNCVKSNFSLALFGIIGIVGSVFMGLGVLGYMEVPISLITLEVIPFLILAIGVDNMFLIYHSVNRVPHS